MTAITTQLADFVVETINANQPYAVELLAERKPVAHWTREDIECMRVTVAAGVRGTERTSRKQWDQRYPIQVVVDYAVDTEDNTKADAEHEVIEQITDVLKRSEYRNPTFNGRRLSLEVIEEDEDSSGLTDSQHLAVTLVVQYREIYG